MTRTHLILMEDLCKVFQLHTAREDLLINLVHDTLAENKRKEVPYSAKISRRTIFADRVI